MVETMRLSIIPILLSVVLTLPAGGLAQERLSVAEARERALAAGTRARLAEADEAAARAAAQTARAYPNPSASAAFSESPPQYHLTVDQPFELPGLRAARVRAADAEAAAAGLRLEIERAVVLYQVDNAYAQAAAASDLATLSARMARDGEELVRISRTRWEAGDASELDVELARVAQGAVADAARTDSLGAITAVLELQALMGMPAERVSIQLADSLSLAPPAVPGAGDPAQPLATAAARADVQARLATVARERANRFGTPSLMAGVEWHDPSGGETGYLPTFGVSIPLPLWDHSRGPVAAAQAGLLRARVVLAAAERDAAASLAAAERRLAAAVETVARDRELLAHAERVVDLSTRGYREGAFPITVVLAARTAARETLRQSIQDRSALRAARSAAELARTIGAAP
jgi:cobalt-zinc-cadmium efflux system outer membrane protein